ncbi:MAG: hypothetical protein RR357_04020 [Clostridia bacterium]
MSFRFPMYSAPNIMPRSIMEAEHKINDLFSQKKSLTTYNICCFL